MTKRTDYFREYMQRYRADGRDKSRRAHAQKHRPFVGCDGEGWNLPNGYHAYFMLRIGDQTLKTKGSAVRLSTQDCLSFIADQNPDNIYVGYFFDYDVTKILEDLPWDKLDRLLNRAKRMSAFGKLFPVDWRGFQIEYLPRKEFKVRRLLSQVEDQSTWSKWVVINDVGSFFQMPFLNAIRNWDVGTVDDHRNIEVGKSGRASFSLQDIDEISAYNSLEIRLLETLMERFRGACVDAGYIPRKWQGPGVLAEAMFKAHKVPESKNISLLKDCPELVRFATNAYYGGRTEVAVVGPVEKPTYQYDINSAYPYAMQFVPCLLHGQWEHFTEFDTGWRYDRPTGRKGETFALMYGSFRHRGGPHTMWYGLPVRTAQGTIVYPESGSGWYWSFEIQSAIHQTFEPEEAWVYTRQCNCEPLGFVRDVYATRQRIGKDGPGIVLKLGMNSLYGKTVQSIGEPKYANPIWGSFITAFPRMQIQDFIHSSPDCRARHCGYDILMVATDSVATLRNRTEREYEDSKRLGGWSQEIHPLGIFVVQPGVYFGSSGKPSKTRGVPRTVVDAYEEVFQDAFDTMVASGEMSDGDVSVPQKIFCGIRYALHRRNVRLLGQWIEFGEEGKSGKVISFDWTSKRAPDPALAPHPPSRTWIQTFPYSGDTGIVSVPYSKDIGGLRAREDARLAFSDQPDWAGIDYD